METAGGGGGSFTAMEESAATGVRRGKRRDSTQRSGAEQHSPAREACLLTRRGGRGLGAEARASEVGSQGEDWGWWREHSLKGLVRLSEKETPSGDLHAEAGPNPKLNPRSCANKEDKGKSLPAASGAVE